MKSYYAALWPEFLKVRRSKIIWATIAVSFLVPCVIGLFMIILKDPEQAKNLGLIGTKAQMVAGTADWPAFFNSMSQAGAIAGLFVFGFVAVWVFGREYSDRTMKDLLALPTARWAIVTAKLTVVLIWCLALTVLIYALGLGIGAVIGLPQWSSELAIQSGFNFGISCLLTIACITPVCLAANLGRGYLLPLGFVILVLAAAQILAVMGWGEYFPWAIPALYSEIRGSAAVLSPASYIIVILTCIAGTAATFAWWYKADQTR